MLSIGIIIFREILEIALILGVLLAATRSVNNRNKWVWGGLAVGVLGSWIVACFAETISQLAEGMGQELFNAGILFLAGLLIGWTVVWMRRHARELTHHLKEVGQAVTKGEKSLYSLAIVVFLSVLREGSEIVLFTYGILVSERNIPQLIFGAGVGLLAGIAAGMAIYYGLLKISTRWLFTVTSWMLIFVAAGMVSEGIGFLQSGGFVPVMVNTLWDSSGILAESSLIGSVLHILIGYTERPSGIQFFSYLTTLLIIFLILRFYGSIPTVKKLQA